MTKEQALTKIHLLMGQCNAVAKAGGINFLAVADADLERKNHRYYIRCENGFAVEVVNVLFKEVPGVKEEFVKGPVLTLVK